MRTILACSLVLILASLMPLSKNLVLPHLSLWESGDCFMGLRASADSIFSVAAQSPEQAAKRALSPHEEITGLTP